MSIATTKDIKKILEEKNSSSKLLYLFNEINKYINFDEEQIVYLINYDSTGNYLLNNYFYKRLELRYKDEIKEYLNNIIFNFLPRGNPETMEIIMINDDNRIDIEMFAKIIKIYINLKNDLRLIIKKNYSINLIIDELELKLSKEKNILEKIITKINKTSIKNNQTLLIFKSKLENKLEKLNMINKPVLKTLFIDDIDYDKQRQKLIKILNSLLILIETFIAIIINFGIIRKTKTTYKIETLAKYFYYEGTDAIHCYLNTISETVENTSPDDFVDINNNYKQNLKIQKKFYYNIINDLNFDHKIETYYKNIVRYLKYFEKIDEKALKDYYKKLINDIEESEKMFGRRPDEIKPTKTKSLSIYRSISKIKKSLLIRTGFRKPQTQKREILKSLELFNKQVEERISLGIKKIIRTDLYDISWEYWERPEIKIKENFLNKLYIKNDNLVENKSIEELFNNDYISHMKKQEYIDFFNEIKINLIEYSKNFKINEFKQHNYSNLKKKYQYFFNDNKKNGIPTLNNYIGNSIISLFIRYIENDKKLKFVDSNDTYVCNYIISKNDKDELKDERQIGIDLDGLRRDFITSLTNELFKKEIFITREDTSIYFLNPNYRPDKYEKYIIKKHLTNIDDNYYENEFIFDFYKFLGVLISFIIVNDCGLDYYLSSYLTSLFFNKDKEKENINNLIYMINDFPNNFNIFANLMKKPADISCGITFNDTYDLIPEDKDLDENNIIEYLYEISKFINKKSILRKDIELSSASIEKQIEIININTLMYICFKEGIPKEIKDDFTNNNFTDIIIKSYLKTPDMSEEIIEKLINNLIANMYEKYVLKKITEIFIEYVLRNNKGKHENKESYFKFITKLLKFWSASTFYKETGKYKIEINPNLSISHLPQSHTCFFMIDLPDYRELGSDEEIGNKLFDSINTAIFNIEDGFGLAGGGHRRRIRRIRKK